MPKGWNERHLLLSPSPPSFPCLHTLPFTTVLKHVGVTIFHGNASRSPSQVIRLTEEDAWTVVTDADKRYEDAKNLIGKTVHVNWPFHLRALVVGVSSSKGRYHLTGSTTPVFTAFDAVKTAKWKKNAQLLYNDVYFKCAIDPGLIEQVCIAAFVGGSLSPHTDTTTWRRSDSSHAVTPCR